jgi:non-specific serine/threonine protein kinase
MIGTTLLNRYKIESELGKGGMGIVYKAQDTLLNRVVAIKFLNTSGVGTEGKLRLLREARAVAQLNHPNIVSIYDAGEADDTAFIVMELVNGHTLRRMEKTNLLDTLHMAQQICLALDHAHSNGIIHRDLKLENIVITNSQTLKLMDFGLAHTADDNRLSEEGTLTGTLAYLAPELIQGQPATVQSDLYAFGVILYELLIGRAPFEGTISSMLAQHMHGKVTPPSEVDSQIPAWADELVLRLLSKHPEERPASAKDLLLILEQESSSPPTTTLFSIFSKTKNNLPTQLTSFIGREKEIAEIKVSLVSSRLVTLTGSGGTGKTRLSIEVGAQLLSTFSNGVWLIELAPLSDESQIIPALAQAFGLQELPFNPLKNLVMDYLRDKKLLLILDNCEHLIAACARLADELLHQCAGLKILASSREALGIAGEVAYRTPSLADSESTSLFVDRARAANSKFSLTDSNASSVAQICSRLNGIPLAIELAAARTKLLSADQIASRLDDLFRLLVGGSRTALPRQQTLRALIDWSYDLLSEEEKNLLRIASVFVGGWTLEALEAVSEDSHALEHLEGLVNKSLVVTEEHKGEMRYFLLETIRQYAREKLFEAKQSSAARDRHFIHFNKLADGLWNVYLFQGESEIKKLKAMQIETDNLRAAFEWGMQNNLEDMLNLAANIAMSLSVSGGQLEGIAILKVALEKFRGLPPAENDLKHKQEELLMRACFSLGTITVGSGEIMLSRSALQEAIAIARKLGDKFMLGYGLEMFSNASIFIKAEDSLPAALEGLEIFKGLNNISGLAIAYGNLSRWAGINGNFEESRKYLELLQGIAKDIPLSFQSGILFLGLGYNTRNLGQLETAKKHFEAGLKMFEYIGHKGFEAVMTTEIAHVERVMGNYAKAKNTYKETIKEFQDVGNRPAVAHQLECFAMIAIVEEEPQRAAKLFAAAEAIREVTGHKRSDEEEAEEAQFMSRLRAMLTEAEFNALWADGKSTTTEQAIQLALG